MYLFLVFLPLIGALSAGFFGRYLGESVSSHITVFGVFVAFISSLFVFYEVGFCGNVTYLVLVPWVDLGLFSVQWGFQFDSLTVVMLLVVTSVSFLVHLYSIAYMAGDPHKSRFISYLSLFTFFMLILVTSDNFLQIFVGWEGVGLCSYLLINFWYTRIQANKAAIKAMVVNRIGDVGLALGVMAIFFEFKALDYCTVFALVPSIVGKTVYFLNFEVSSLDIICILLFVGAVGKSAQLGLHTWLPDAMEGPTPVSALIHAATIVTAGVFLLARCSPLLEYAPNSLGVILIFGAMTAFFAASTGLLQNDLKRVIAYSTCSQLGYMVFACGLSSYSAGVFHLANHAFFKALLFLSAGSVIHAMGDEQDIRRIGGIRQLLPFTYSMVFVGSLALLGFPFLTGFYSKDVILEVAYASYSVPGHFAHWLGTLSALFTAFYSIRLLHLTFLGSPRGYRRVVVFVHDAPILIFIPLFILGLCSIFAGYLLRDLFIGVGTCFWQNSLFTHPHRLLLLESEFIPHFIKLVPVVFSVFGAFLGFYWYSCDVTFLYFVKVSPMGRHFYTFFNRKWFFDKVYNEYVTQTLLHCGYFYTYKVVDRGLVEMLGPFGIVGFLYGVSRWVSFFQTGYIYHYTLVILSAVAFLLAILFVYYTCTFYLFTVFGNLFLLFFVTAFSLLFVLFCFL